MPAPKLRNVIRAIYETPWAIQPATLALIVEVAEFRAAGGKLTDDEIAERIAAAGPTGPRTGARGGAVAVLPVYGVLTPRQNLMSATSGGTSLDILTAQFRAALADPEVGAIALDIDSPGGAVDGVEELAAEIRAARGQKPIVAVANTLAASAAYWIAAQADELVASPSAQVGSIGVIAAHRDLSEAHAQAGVCMTLITHGKYKAEATEYAPLSEEARAELQAKVDAYGAMFEQAVAKGRRTSVEAVRADYGEGRVLIAKRALAAGMIDRIETLDATIARLGRALRATTQAAPQAIRGARAELDEQPASDYPTPDAHPDDPPELELDESDGTAPVGDQPADEMTTTTAGLVAGLTFTSRLAAVTAEAAELATIARARASRRAGTRKPVSADHRAQLEELRASLLATAGELEATLAQDDGPSPAPIKPGARLEVALAAYRGGYRLND